MRFNPEDFLLPAVVFLLLQAIPVFAQNGQDILKKAKELSDRAKAMEADIDFSNDKHLSSIKGKAKKLYRSPEFQERLKAQTHRLREKMVLSGLNGSESARRGARKGMTFSGSGGMIYLFISKSVPLSTLRNYAADMERVGSSNIRMVMRGFVGGMRSFRQTSRFVREILIKEPDCEPSPGKRCEAYSAEVTIDPVLFSRYGIDRVPAVAYVDEPQATDERFNAMSEFHVLFGDVSLSYALETINEKAKNGKLAKIIKNLRSGFFDGGKYDDEKG